MTPSKGVFYGTVVVLVAFLIISTTVAAVYYGQEQTNASQNQRYAKELSSALASYRSLSSSFNASLAEYGMTLSLLSSAVANLNTSTPAYRNASVALSSLWSSYQQLLNAGGRKALVYATHMLVDLGNGTSRWYNSTAIQPGWNGYVVSLVLLNGNVQSVWYPQYGEHLITGIDGVAQTASTSWFLWEFSGGIWTASQTGADQLRIGNGTVMAWTLCGHDANFNPMCTP